MFIRLMTMFAVGAIAAFGVSCQNQQAASPTMQATRKNLNLLHGDDPNLAGIIIYQNDPVNMEDDPPRPENEHPWGIVYYFWEGSRVRYVAYDERGKIVRDDWRPRYLPVSKEEWLRVDFAYGSDPLFKHHTDPRLKVEE